MKIEGSLVHFEKVNERPLYLLSDSMFKTHGRRGIL